MNKLYIILSFSILLLTSCENEFPTNETGEYFENLLASNNVEILVVVHSESGIRNLEKLYKRYSFLGNNFIRVWTEIPPSNEIFYERNYNLEKVIWYNIEKRKHNGEEFTALLIQFEHYER